MLAGVVGGIRGTDKGIVTIVKPESKLNREKFEERDIADGFGELGSVSHM